MNTLTRELRATISRHVEKADRHEIASIVSALCAHEDVAELVFNGRPPAPESSPRFEVIGEVVRDNTTGLTWTRGNVVTAKQLTWEDAKAACEKLAGGGWRLPTIKELLTLVDYERHNPAIDPVFDCEPSCYWTSTTHAPPSPGDCAWGVGFDGGLASWGLRGHSGFVRAVRASQS